MGCYTFNASYHVYRCNTCSIVAKDTICDISDTLWVTSKNSCSWDCHHCAVPSNAVSKIRVNQSCKETGR